MGDKIVETCPQMESFGEQNNSHPSPPLFNVEVFVVFYNYMVNLQVARTAAQHYMEEVRKRK